MTQPRLMMPRRSFPRTCFRMGRQTTATTAGEHVPIRFQIALPASRRPLVSWARCGTAPACGGRGSVMDVVEKKLFIHSAQLEALAFCFPSHFYEAMLPL